MKLKNKRVGLAITGSHCTLPAVIKEIEVLIQEGAEVLPILSPAISTTDTKFGAANEWLEKLEIITGHKPITTIVEAEPIGPKKLLDVVVIAPCTGNSMAKLANGITDTPVLMATKAHLRNQRPVVIAIATNDGLGANAKNLGILLNMKNIYMVPFGQDNPSEKNNSLVAHWQLLTETVILALKGKQIQPILIGTN